MWNKNCARPKAIKLDNKHLNHSLAARNTFLGTYSVAFCRREIVWCWAFIHLFCICMCCGAIARKTGFRSEAHESAAASSAQRIHTRLSYFFCMCYPQETNICVFFFCSSCRWLWSGYCCCGTIVSEVWELQTTKFIITVIQILHFKKFTLMMLCYKYV